MKKLFRILVVLFIMPIFVNADAQSFSESGSKTKYFKTVEYYGSYDYGFNYINFLANDFKSEVYELSKEDYYREVAEALEKSQFTTFTSKTDTTSYKKLTISYEPTLGGRYRVKAIVDWDVMPYYRRIDHLGTTHMVVSALDIRTGSMTYTKGGTVYNESHSNPLLAYNEYWLSYGQIVDHDLPNDSLFSNVTDIKFEISYEVTSNPASDLCAVIYHQDTSTIATNYLARYFYGDGDIRLGNSNMGTLYSIQTVCF